MNNPFRIVKDSSIWQSSYNQHGLEHKDPYLRIGIVKGVYQQKNSHDLRYLVEIQDRSNRVEVNARLLRKFGGAYNYEDTVLRGYKIDDKPDSVSSFDAKAGDTVLVAFLNGEAREAVILGGISHPSRKSPLNIKNGPQHISEFNGIETSINESGEYRLTFKALPTNLSKLNDKPSSAIKPPTYNTKIGGSYFLFDKTGSMHLNDVAQNGPQSVKINKPDGKIEIVSGNIKLTLTKSSQSVDLQCKLVNISAADKMATTTKQFNVNASTSLSLKSPKVAIGKDGVELLDQLFQLVEALSAVTPISPIGPCTPLKSTPQWGAVAAVQNKVKSITGSL